MTYPEKFIEKVKAEFPDCERLHEMLDKGESFVGRYLEESIGSQMKEAEVITAFDEGRQEEVYNDAKKSVHRRELYTEWYKLYQAHYPPR